VRSTGRSNDAYVRTQTIKFGGVEVGDVAGTRR
jgi:hypothetical protein